MINMNMFFEFMSMILKNHMFKINLIRYFENASGVRFICWLFKFQKKSKLVDEILDFFKKNLD